MGLQIPSSDLVHLSTMSFSSYARALWRNHGHNTKGRLLLLLLELCLRDGDGKKQNGVDGDFVLSLVSELTRKQLPRSLLMGLELISANNAAAASVKSHCKGQETLQSAVQKSATLILRDLQSYQTSPNRGDSNEGYDAYIVNTIQRLCSVVTNLSDENLPVLVQALRSFADGCTNEKLKQEMTKMAAYCSSEWGEPVSFIQHEQKLETE